MQQKLSASTSTGINGASGEAEFMRLMKRIGRLSEDKICRQICTNFKHLPDRIKFAIANYYCKFPFWGRLDANAKQHEAFRNCAKALRENFHDFTWLYEKLADDKSKQVLHAIVSNWFDFDFESLERCKETEHPEYFNPIIFPRRSNEVFVDLGAYTGDSVSSFLKAYRNYKRIYCYEITPSVFETLKANLSSLNNIEFRHKAAGSSSDGYLYLSEGVTHLPIG